MIELCWKTKDLSGFSPNQAKQQQNHQITLFKSTSFFFFFFLVCLMVCFSSETFVPMGTEYAGRYFFIFPYHSVKPRATNQHAKNALYG